MYKVILADDEENILIGIKLGIDWKKLNCEIIGTATDGSEAIALIKENTPDIILSDISMDPLDGLGICKYVVDNELPTKCLLMTGYHDFEKAYQAINYGVSRLLLKPTSVADIEGAINQVISEIEKKQESLSVHEKLNLHSRENILLKRTILFRNIISGDIRKEDVKDALLNLGMNMNAFFAATLRMDCHKEDGKSDYFADRYIDSIFAGIDKYIVHWSPTIEYMLFPLKEQNSKDINNIYEKLKCLSSIMDAMTDYFIMIGISAIHNDVSDMKQAIEESNEASRYVSYNHEYPIVEYLSLPELSSFAMKKVRAYLMKINESIQKLEFEKASLYVRMMFEEESFKEVSFNDTANIADFISSMCVQQQLFYGGEGFNIRDNVQNQSSLKQSKTKDEILNATQAMFRMFSDRIQYRDTADDLISKVKDYINSNYALELSLESMGNAFGISPGYLGKLFKQSEGMNLSNYIQYVRIEKAKDLILNSTYHTYEIGEKVGITDAAYFSKLFKKITGYRVRDFKEAVMLHSTSPGSD